MSFLAIILFPFSVLYDLITRFRNHLYNIGYKRSFSFETNVIAVGNLSVGGTGKTPMVEYLIRLLKSEHKITTLSRGYGRKTKGFILATEKDNADSIGDEPFQMYKKFEDINVVVCEDRALAIPFILSEKAETEIILLDDAYQHRSVKPGLNIMLSDYSKPFYSDFVLPSGRLRESRKGAERADIIIVTKCPYQLDAGEQQKISAEVMRYNQRADIYFTSIKYGALQSVQSSTSPGSKLLAFSGIAKPQLFIDHLKSQYDLVKHIDFKDHHNYSERNIKELVSMLTPGVSLVTTEKDMVKLIKPEFRQLMNDLSIFYLPIEAYFLKDGRRFDDQIQKSIRKYSY